MTSTLEVVPLHPTPEQLRYTFGGGEPLLRVRPGTVVELTTEDCFGGRVRTAADLPSQVCEFPYLNPVTGPIHVEGAEPGDTLAVHVVDIAPARDWAVSTTFPHFGALTATHATAMLHDPLEEAVWVYEVDRERGTCLFRPRRGDRPAPPGAAHRPGRHRRRRPRRPCADPRPLSRPRPAAGTMSR